MGPYGSRIPNQFALDFLQSYNSKHVQYQLYCFHVYCCLKVVLLAFL